MTMTNDELNERIALALGWESCPRTADCWYGVTGSTNPHHAKHKHNWATDAQACLDDLLPVMQAKVPGKLRLEESDDEPGEWVVFWDVANYSPDWFNHAADTLARAICLVFLAVMEATP